MNISFIYIDKDGILYDKGKLGISIVYVMKDQSIMAVEKPSRVFGEQFIIEANTESDLLADLVKRCNYMFNIGHQIQHVIVGHKDIKHAANVYSIEINVVAAEKFIKECSRSLIENSVSLVNGLYSDFKDPAETFKNALIINKILHS